MSPRLLLSFLLASMLSALSSGTALAQDTTDTPANTAPVIEQLRFEGTQAFATWSTDNAQTTVAILDGQLQDDGGRPINEPTLFVDHLAVNVDPATGTGSFTVLGATVPLEPGQFGIDAQLRNAFVMKDATLEGATCALPGGEDCEFFTADVSVSVTWTGQDGITSSAYVFRDIESDFRYVFRAQGTLREAIAEGLITGDVDLISGPSTYADIGRTSNSDILWMRPG
jgi:hypothetical protein